MAEVPRRRDAAIRGGYDCGGGDGCRRPPLATRHLATQCEARDKRLTARARSQLIGDGHSVC